MRPGQFPVHDKEVHSQCTLYLEEKIMCHIASENSNSLIYPFQKYTLNSLIYLEMLIRSYHPQQRSAENNVLEK